MKHTTTRLIATCAAIFAMPLVSNAQNADPFGGGSDKPSKGKASQDPFADPAKANPKKAPKGADPFASEPRAEEISDRAKPRTIELTYEVFSLPMKEAAALQRTGIEDADFYQKMVSGVAAGKIRHEKVLISRNHPGQNSVVKQISEHYYNTEAEPPELPNVVGPGYNAESALKIVENSKKNPDRQGADLIYAATPAHPTAYDLRNVGDTMESEAMVDANLKYIDLRLSVEHVSLIDYDFWGEGLSEVKMPRFSVPGFHTGVTVVDVKPSFVGTISPPKDLQKGTDGGQTWLAFVTASAVAH